MTKRHRSLQLVLYIQILLAFGLNAQDLQCYMPDHDGRSRDHNADFQTLMLEVAFAPEEGLVMGTANYSFSIKQQKADTLFLDGINMTYKKVLLDGKPAKYRHSDKGISLIFDPPLEWDEVHRLIIDYEVQPRKGIYFIGWDDPTGRSRKQIWTQGQAIDHRHWIPGYDFQNDKLITETVVHFPRDYEVLSNGDFLGVEDPESGTLTWHYKMDKPHALYLLMIAIGKYDYKELTGKNGVIMKQYFYPDRPGTFEPTYQHSVRMMDWMEQEFGLPYPWKTYANVPVQDFIYGAMENTTATVFTDFYVQDERAAMERNYVGTNAHELVHQWFGDYITAWSGEHHWLHESFATFYAKEFRRSVDGEDDYQWIRRGELGGVLRAGERNDYPIAHSKAGGSRHYSKGSLVLDMMMHVLGREQFKRGIATFLKQNAYSNVSTEDLWQAFLETLGINLDWFFDQWIYRGGEPSYEIAHSIDKDKTTFVVSQVQQQEGSVGLFRMPIDFHVYYEGHSADSTTQWVEGPVDTIVVPNPQGKRVDFVLFDPNSRILKRAKYLDKTEKEWMAQMLGAAHMIDRYDALRALEDVDAKAKRKSLVKAYESESYGQVRGEVIGQLAKDDHKTVPAILVRALHDVDHRVRRKVITSLDVIPEELRQDSESLLTDRSYYNVEQALRKLCTSFPEKEAEYLSRTDKMRGMNNNIRITWLEIAAAGDHPGHLTELADLAGPAFEHRTRSKALQSIAKLNRWNDTVFESVLSAALKPNRRLSGPAKRTMRKLMSDSAFTERLRAFYASEDRKQWEKDALQSLMEKKEAAAGTN